MEGTNQQGIIDQFDEFFGRLANGTEAEEFWTCASSAVGDTTRVESGYGYGLAEAPTSLFIATDSKGLCQKAQQYWNKAPAGGYAKEYYSDEGSALAAEGIHNIRAPLACFNMDPVHLAKTETASMQGDHHEHFGISFSHKLACP